jgi:hypothetical protein
LWCSPWLLLLRSFQQLHKKATDMIWSSTGRANISSNTCRADRQGNSSRRTSWSNKPRHRYFANLHERKNDPQLQKNYGRSCI